MSQTSFNQIYTVGPQIVNIPDNAINVEVICRGNYGGNGFGGGNGGRGKVGQFRFNSNFVSRSLRLRMGAPGQNGSSPSGGSGGGSWSLQARGGDGGPGQYTQSGSSYWANTTCSGNGMPCYQLNPPFPCNCQNNCRGIRSCGDGINYTLWEKQCRYCYTNTINTGGGGGGGGANGIEDLNSGTPLIVAGGGAGGGGFGSGGSGFDAGSWSGTTSSIGLSVGANGGNRGSGGGTGGGGGGASPQTNWQQNSNSRYRSDIVTLISNLENYQLLGQQPEIRVSYTSLFPEINSFSANPNPQTSPTGVPTYTSTLNWQVSDFQYSRVTGPGVDFTTSNNPASLGITLPQSNADGTSPACNTYTLTVYAGSQSVSQNLQVCAFNDDDITTINIGTTGQPFGNPIDGLEPNTVYYVQVTWTGTDMPILCESPQSGTSVSINALNWSNSIICPDGNPLYVRFTSLPFNTSTAVGGGGGGDPIVGSPNPKTINFEVGGVQYSFVATTRPPVIEENFDQEGLPLSPDAYPNPDIDTVVPDVNLPFVTTNEINANDIEIPVEIKTDLADAQVQINNDGVWRDMREIGS